MHPNPVPPAPTCRAQRHPPALIRANAWRTVLCCSPSTPPDRRTLRLPPGKVMVYDQLKSVANQPNPPPGEHSVNNNRKDGYADYQVGQCYIALNNDLAVDGV